MNKVTYYLFGEDAVNTLNSDGFEALLNEIKYGTPYSLFTFTEGVTDPTILLRGFAGYGDFDVITEEQTQTILNIPSCQQ